MGGGKRGIVNNRIHMDKNFKPKFASLESSPETINSFRRQVPLNDEDKFGSAPIFLGSKERKEWESMDESVKEDVKRYLSLCAEKMENKMFVNMLSVVVEDLIKEVAELRDKLDKLSQ